DDVYTAPHHGFGTAANYYQQASAIRVVDRIAMPTLLLAADDDPFVPAGQFRAPAVAANPHIHVQITHHGGHCAFVEEAAAGYDGYFAERTALEFLQAALSARPHLFALETTV